MLGKQHIFNYICLQFIQFINFKSQKNGWSKQSYFNREPGKGS